MKKLLLIHLSSVMLYSMNVIAEVTISVDGNAEKLSANAKKYCVESKEKIPDESGNFVYSGSRGFKNCEKISMGNISEIYETKKYAEWNWGNAIANGVCKTSCEAAIQTKDSKDFDQCFDKYAVEVPKCISMLHVMEGFNRDFKNTNHNQEVFPTVQGQSGMITQNNQNQNAQNQAAINVAQTDDYKCKNLGMDTLDYEVCKKFSDYAAGLEVASQAVNVGQNLYYQNKAMDTGFEASKNMANDATAALKAQKSTFKDQQSYFTQNSAIEASKAAYLATIRAEMPTREDVMNKCKGSADKIDTFYAANPTMRKSNQASSDTCSSIVTNARANYNFLVNEQSKEKMTEKLVKLGVNAIAEGTKAYFAGKRADQVDSAIASVNSFTPTTTPGLEQAVETTYCTMNPTAAKCIGKMNSAFSTIGDNIIDFNGNGAGTVYSGNIDNGNGDSSSSTPSATSGATNSKGIIGSAITSVNKGSGILDPATAASLQKGSASPGGAGAGGAGGGGLGGGSGSGPLPTPAQQGGVTAAVAGNVKNYGSSGGGISMLGGKMAVAKKADSSANPFGNLFGKKTDGDKVINFRGPASTNVGNKGDNIFDMIHNRYNWASDKKLVLEYEEVTK